MSIIYVLRSRHLVGSHRRWLILARIPVSDPVRGRARSRMNNDCKRAGVMTITRQAFSVQSPSHSRHMTRDPPSHIYPVEPAAKDLQAQADAEKGSVYTGTRIHITC
jgi:hypothetical protein